MLTRMAQIVAATQTCNLACTALLINPHWIPKTRSVWATSLGCWKRWAWMNTFNQLSHTTLFSSDVVNHTPYLCTVITCGHSAKRAQLGKGYNSESQWLCPEIKSTAARLYLHRKNMQRDFRKRVTTPPTKPASYRDIFLQRVWFVVSSGLVRVSVRAYG